VLLYALSLQAILLGSMTLQILLPDTVRSGEAVPITLRLTNSDRKPATAYLQGRPTAFDIIVTRRDGTPVWRRLEGAVIPAVLQVRSLAPGAVLEFHGSWPQRTNLGAAVGPGEYLVTGVLPTDPPAELRTHPAPLRILP
jgi:intracellular proteinase inhibitor BsuPI